MKKTRSRKSRDTVPLSPFYGMNGKSWAYRGWERGVRAGMGMLKFMWDSGASFLRVHTSSTVRYMLHPPLKGIGSRYGYFFEGL